MNHRSYSFLAYFDSQVTTKVEAAFRQMNLSRWSSGKLAENGDMLIIATRKNVRGATKSREYPNAKIKGGYTVVRITPTGETTDLGYSCDTPSETADLVDTILNMGL